MLPLRKQTQDQFFQTGEMEGVDQDDLAEGGAERVVEILLAPDKDPVAETPPADRSEIVLADVQQLAEALLLPGQQLGPRSGEIAGDCAQIQKGLTGLLPEVEKPVSEFDALKVRRDAEVIPGPGIEAGVKGEGPLLLLEQRRGGDEEQFLELFQRQQAQAGQLPACLEHASGRIATRLAREEQQGLTAAPLLRGKQGFIKADIAETERTHADGTSLWANRTGSIYAHKRNDAIKNVFT